MHFRIYNSAEWTRHIAFRDFLVNNEVVREAYSNLKLKLSKHNWLDGNAYSQAKDSFIKKIDLAARLGKS